MVHHPLLGAKTKEVIEHPNFPVIEKYRDLYNSAIKEIIGE